jgi:hypothetical protein
VAIAGNVSVKCSSLTPAQQKIIEGIPEVLNKILSNQLDINLVMDKLDEIAKAVEKIRTPPPRRRIQPEDRTEIIRILSEKAGTVSVNAIADDSEAYRFAQDWYDVLKDAHWKMQDPVVRTIIIEGPPFSGVIMRIHGQPTGTPIVSIPQNSPGGRLGMSLERAKTSYAVELYLDVPDGTVLLGIGHNAEQ